MRETYGVYDTDDKHWEYSLGTFSLVSLAEKAADTMRGYWRERYEVYPLQSWEIAEFNKKGLEIMQNEKAEADTWGVWDTQTNSWVEGYHDIRGHWHERKNINQRHAQNAANKMNGYTDDRYEARDMMLEKSVIEDEPVLTRARIQEEIDNRRGTIAHLEDEIKALEMAAMLLGVK